MSAAEEAAGAAGAAGVGGLIGGMVIRQAGMTAVGMVGGGAGVGAAAGPVGIAVGALAGLAAYGLYRVGCDFVGENSYEVTYWVCPDCHHLHYTALRRCSHFYSSAERPDMAAPRRCPCSNEEAAT